MRRWMKTVLAAVVAAAALVAVPPAQAELAQGDRAPEFKGREFVNTTSVDLQTLAGRVVLLEIFRTW